MFTSSVFEIYLTRIFLKMASEKDILRKLYQPVVTVKINLPKSNIKTKKMAEREGFEPSDAFASAVFKTAALNHSTISPCQLYKITSKRVFYNSFVLNLPIFLSVFKKIYRSCLLKTVCFQFIHRFLKQIFRCAGAGRYADTADGSEILIFRQ